MYPPLAETRIRGVRQSERLFSRGVLGACGSDFHESREADSGSAAFPGTARDYQLKIHKSQKDHGRNSYNPVGKLYFIGGRHGIIAHKV